VAYDFTDDEGEVQPTDPITALLAAGKMHDMVHILEDVDMVEPEDTVFLQINLQEELLIHSAITTLQVMNACLDDVCNEFLGKLASVTSAQKEGAWVARLKDAVDVFNQLREDGQE